MHVLTVAASALVAVLIGTAPMAAQDTIKVGVTSSGVPFTFVDATTQKPTGAMLELASAIAADIGATPQFEVIGFSALVPSLTTGKIDIVSASMFATDARRQVVDFSSTVYSFGEGLFVASSDAKDYTLQDLKGEAVGAQIGTIFVDDLKALGIFKEIKLYDSIADIMRDVKLGRIKAGFGDKPIVAYRTSQDPTIGVRLIESYKPLRPGNVALAVAKTNPQLLAKVNAALAKLEQSGDMKKIFTKYGL
jgi:polar amino acid transport system substrate-binding protein